MVEVGIPVYNAVGFLMNALDSLVAQTEKDFSVCLSIDGDGHYDEYKEMADEYTRRGLNIRIINNDENRGPGIARQRILDTTESDYIMFLDSDDMLMPRAVSILYKQAKQEEYDMVRSSFIREEKDKQDILLPQNINTITWFHGKIYRTAYLKDNKIYFHPNLRADEDAFFNLIAWNSAKKRGETSEVTYIWRFNENSITRGSSGKEYFMKTYMYYMTSQVEGLCELFRLNPEVDASLVMQTLINTYTYYMRARYYNLDEASMEALITKLKLEEQIQRVLQEGSNWIYVIEHLKAGELYDNSIVVFYNESFNLWAKRLLINWA